MKQILLIGLLFSTLFVSGQTDKRQLLKTAKYAGVYAFGKNTGKRGMGSITIYPETDTTILFFIDIYGGAPSYNLGQLYSRLTINNGQGVYYSKEDLEGKGCKWQVTINSKALTIKTLDNCYACGFGNNIYADNQYKQKSKAIPNYFIDGPGDKIYFSKTSPESYSK
jgi:hypothetical protein